MAGQPYNSQVSQSLVGFNSPADLVRDTHEQLARLEQQARFGLNNPNGDQFMASPAARAGQGPAAPPNPAMPNPAASGIGGMGTGNPQQDAMLAALLGASQAGGGGIGSPGAGAQGIGGAPGGLPPQGAAPIGGMPGNPTPNPAQGRGRVPPMARPGAQPLVGPDGEKIVGPGGRLAALFGAPLLLIGATKALDNLENRGGINRAGSEVGKMARWLGHNSAFEGINETLENRVYPWFIKQNDGFRQTLLMPEKAHFNKEFDWDYSSIADDDTLKNLWPERADARYLSSEYDALNKLVDGQPGRFGKENLALLNNQKGFQAFLTKPPTQWGASTQHLLAKEILRGDLSDLTQDQLKLLTNAVTEHVDDVPDWIRYWEYEEKGNWGDLKKWLRSTLKKDKETVLNKVAKDMFEEAYEGGWELSTSRSSGELLEQVLRDLTSEDPRNAKRLTELRVRVSRPYQDQLRKKLLENPRKINEGLAKLDKSNLFKANGWRLDTADSNHLNNLDEAKGMLRDLVGEVDNELLPNDKYLERVDELSDRAGVKKLMNEFKGISQRSSTKANNLVRRLKGVFGRTNQTLASHHIRYYNDLDAIRMMEDTWGTRKNLLYKKFNQLGLFKNNPEFKKEFFEFFDDAPNRANWVEDCQKLLTDNLEHVDEVSKEALDKAVKQVNGVHNATKNIKPVRGLGRLWVKLHRDVRRLFTGEAFDFVYTIVPDKANEQKGLFSFLSKGMLGQFFKFFGAGVFMMPVITETIKADPGVDKGKTFARELVGNFMATMGSFAIMNHLAGAFKAVVGKWPTKKLPKMPVTLGGVALYMIGASIIASGLSWAGRKITDIALLGAPKHVQRKRANEKAAKQQGMTPAQRSGLPAQAANRYRVGPSSPLYNVQETGLPADHIAHSHIAESQAVMEAVRNRRMQQGFQPGYY